jgi:hypothetical protein
VFGSDARAVGNDPTDMSQPPKLLDGARVLQFASLAQAQPTGNTMHVVHGVVANRFAAVAIAKYDEDARGVYLFYCDDDWNVITDTLHEDVSSAIQQANFEFGLLAFESV